MKGPEFGSGIEEEIDFDDDNMGVTVKCPFCPLIFSGARALTEEDLYKHLWKVHQGDAVSYMLDNMYVPPNILDIIFEELGFDYVSWLVDRGDMSEDR